MFHVNFNFLFFFIFFLFTLCLSCGFVTKYMEPLKLFFIFENLRFAEDGANFSINSDDPMVTGTWLEQVKLIMIY